MYLFIFLFIVLVIFFPKNPRSSCYRPTVRQCRDGLIPPTGDTNVELPLDKPAKVFYTYNVIENINN